MFDPSRDLLVDGGSARVGSRKSNEYGDTK